MILFSSTSFSLTPASISNFKMLISVMCFFFISKINVGYYFSPFVIQDLVSLSLIILTLYLSLCLVILLPDSRLILNYLVLLVIVIMITFSATNSITFYICFEASLIPLGLIVLSYGSQPERLSSTLFMLFYTISLSLPFLMMITLLKFPHLSEFSSTFILGLLYISFQVLYLILNLILGSQLYFNNLIFNLMKMCYLL